jgi:phenylalanyl-tRNA synthetase beta chain
VSVPAERATKDIRIEEDLIEEVGRMHGYGNIAERALVAAVVPAPRDERRALVRALQDHLSGAPSFREAMTYSFLERESAARLGVEERPHVRIVNPQIEGLDRVRRSVVPSLLAHLAHNRRLASEVRLFELGKGYLPEHANERGEPRERHECALVWLAPRPAKEARFDQQVLVRLKGVVADALDAVGRPVTGWGPASEAQRPPYAHAGRSLAPRFAAGGDGTVLLAALDPEVQVRLGLTGELDGAVAFARIDLDRLLALPATSPRFRPLPRFPGVKVDVAVVLAEERTAGELETVLASAGRGLVESTELFDLYRGASVGAGRKSLAYHVHLRAADRTLDETDCAKYLGRVERLVAELGGELRRA